MAEDAGTGIERGPVLPEGAMERAKPVRGQDFSDVKVGDTVTRLLAEVVPMQLVVTAVDERLIYCGDYTFDRATGFEVDEELHMGPQSGIIGSRLLRDSSD